MTKVNDLGLNLNPTKLPKKDIFEAEKAENITKKIHATTTRKTVVAPEIIEEPVKKTSFDFPISLYKTMKKRLVDDDISMRDYVMDLIKKDLGV